MKFLIWLAIGFAVVTWIMRAKSGFSKADRGTPENTHGKATPAAAESMLRCARCGMHIPASEALINAAGLAFCSEEHRALRDVH
jgi:uncharacterized protein